VVFERKDIRFSSKFVVVLLAPRKENLGKGRVVVGIDGIADNGIGFVISL
jgi:hypothetical protein